MRSLLLILTLLIAASTASAQDATRRVVLTDGTVVVGTVVDETADPVVVLTAQGIEQRIPQASIARIEALAGGRFGRVDPTRTRLVFSPTGRTIGRRGQARLSVLSFLIPTATYAVSSRLDVGGAAVILFGGDVGGVFVPGLKAQVVDAPGLDVAIGASAVVPIVEGANGEMILSPYLATTVGNETTSATVGVTALIGGSLDSGDFELADGALLTLGGEAQLSNRIKVLGEVVVPVGEGSSGAIVMPGLRFFGERFSADVFGVVTAFDGNVGGFLPIASFAYNL